MWAFPPSSCKLYSSFVGSSCCCCCGVVQGVSHSILLLSLDRGDRRLNALNAIGLVRATDTPPPHHRHEYLKNFGEQGTGGVASAGRSAVTQQCVRKFVARFPAQTTKRVRHILPDRLTVSGSVESNCPSARDATWHSPPICQTCCHMPYACDIRPTN